MGGQDTSLFGGTVRLELTGRRQAAAVALLGLCRPRFFDIFGRVDNAGHFGKGRPGEGLTAMRAYESAFSGLYPKARATRRVFSVVFVDDRCARVLALKDSACERFVCFDALDHELAHVVQMRYGGRAIIRSGVDGVMSATEELLGGPDAP